MVARLERGVWIDLSTDSVENLSPWEMIWLPRDVRRHPGGRHPEQAGNQQHVNSGKEAVILLVSSDGTVLNRG
jgi:hypothetical protein